MNLIRFLVGETLYSFHGTIGVIPEKRFDYEKKNPILADKPIQYGTHFVDKLQIHLVATAKVYEELYYHIMQEPAFYIAWHTYSGFQIRTVADKVPYPSRLRFLNDSVSFSLETERYSNPRKFVDPDDVGLDKKHFFNVKWGEGTIATTMWNGDSVAVPAPPQTKIFGGNNHDQTSTSTP